MPGWTRSRLSRSAPRGHRRPRHAPRHSDSPVRVRADQRRDRGGLARPAMAWTAAGPSSARLSFSTRPSNIGSTPGPCAVWIAGLHSSHRSISVRPRIALISSRSSAPWRHLSGSTCRPSTVHTETRRRVRRPVLIAVGTGLRRSGFDPPPAQNRVEARLALAPPTPPGMRVRTGRFAQHSRKRR
jgi:hypothetical protein